MNEVLPQLVYSLSEQNRYYKKTAAYVLKAVAKHSPDLAQAVVDAGALEALVGCLSEFEPTVKESAAWALGFIARHNASTLRLTLCCCVCCDVTLVRRACPLRGGCWCGLAACAWPAGARAVTQAHLCLDPRRDREARDRIGPSRR